VNSHSRRRAQAEEHDLPSTYRIDVNTRSKQFRRYDQHPDDADIFDGRCRRSERKSAVSLLHRYSGPDNTVKHKLRYLHQSKLDTQPKVPAANQGVFYIESDGA
jgi:hypothetical protein